MASRSHNLYIGVTNDIARRVREHKSHEFEGFTERYNIDRLVWYETYQDVHRAIGREKQLKGWIRQKKNKLIEAINPTWQDLSEEWGKPILPLQANRRSLRQAQGRLFDSGGQQKAASAQDDNEERSKQ